MNKENKEEKINFLAAALNICLVLIVAAIYVLIGSLKELWHPGWLIFFAIPIITSFERAVIKKNASRFNFIAVCALIYLCFGLFAGNWHPAWTVFLLVPLYYLGVDIIRKMRNKP